MNLFQQFQTDPKLEKEGVVLEYGLNSKEKMIGIRVARAGGANTAFSKRMEAEVKPLRRQIALELLDLAQINKITRKVFAETVVLGWENVEDADGNDLAFSKEACQELFDKLPALFADLQEQASNIAVFRLHIREADAKN